MTSSLKRVRRAVLTALPLGVRRSYFFWRAHSKIPSLRNPRTFSEKVTWRIVNDRRNLLSWTCDKHEMKLRVKQLDQSVNVVPTLWYGRDVSTIPYDELPDEWVIKPNRQHSGRVHFQSGTPDIKKLTRMVDDWLRDEQAEINRAGQWAYSQAKSGVLVEPRIAGPANGEPPVDYKIFVFDGKAQLIQVHVGRGDNHRQYHMTTDWQETNITTALSGRDAPPARPESLDTMLSQAENIAKDFDFLRVDFYEQDGKPFFGEVTPYPAGGLRKFSPASVDDELGALWTLPIASSRGGASATFEWATGQDDNIGDSLLRRPSLADGRARGDEMHVYHGRLTPTFETAFGLEDDDVSYLSFRKWLLAALKSGFRRPTLIVPNPGEVKVTRGGAARLAAIWIASLAPRARVVWRGAAVPFGGGIWSLPYRAVAKRAKLAAFRDSETVELLGAGMTSPDWAFSLGSDPADWPSPDERTRLAVLLRGARPVPNDEWIAWLTSLAADFDLKLTFVSQVRRDNELACQLADQLGGEAIPFPEQIDHAAQEKLVRDIYRETRIAVSDRLHGLIVAATEGVVPLGWIPSSNGKIARHFNAVDMSFVGRLEGKPAEDLPPVTEEMLFEWEESLPTRISDARRRIEETSIQADAVAPRHCETNTTGLLK